MSTYSDSQLGESIPTNDAYNDYPAPPPSNGVPDAPLDPRDRDPLPPPRGRSRSRSPLAGRRSPLRSSYRGKSPVGAARPKQAPVVSFLQATSSGAYLLM